jgi:hypothetical protein
MGIATGHQQPDIGLAQDIAFDPAGKKVGRIGRVRILSIAKAPL